MMTLITTSLFAQDGDAAAKNAGNAAYSSKNFKEAYTQWEKYLVSVNYTDKAVVYNTAVVANKIKNYAGAVKYFGMSIKNNYKLKSSYMGKALAEEDLGKYDDMLATLKKGIEATGGDVKLEKKYGNYFLAKGLDAQKAGNVDLAESNYKKAAAVTNKEMQIKAYSALSSLYFNKGAKIMESANKYANTNKTQFAADKEKANADFQKAMEYAEEAQLLDVESEEISTMIQNIKDAMK